MPQTMASAIASPEDPSDIPTNGLKRRHSNEEQSRNGNGDEGKRRRTSSSGKDSPTAKAADQEKTQPKQEPTPATSASPSKYQQQPAQKATDTRESRRKSGVADERQRSKRLFGALLGNLNQPSDRVSKRRGEIEQRKKAELQKQDDERLEDRQRRLEKLAIQRKIEQIKVDEDQMRTRHKQLLNVANFLQTRTEPKLYYKPWDLLPDEEDRIEDQIKDAQAQIDKELDEWEAEKRKRLEAIDDPSGGSNIYAESKPSIETAVTDLPQNKEHTSDKVPGDEGDADDQTKSHDTNKSDNATKSAEIAESDPPLVVNAEKQQSEAGAEKREDATVAAKDAEPPADEIKDDADDEDHMVEGDEDNVIY